MGNLKVITLNTWYPDRRAYVQQTRTSDPKGIMSEGGQMIK